MRRTLFFVLVAALLASAVAEAQYPIDLHPGDDTWVTPGGGGTSVTFNTTDLPPLPAGFFGVGSQPFSGTVTFVGKPLTTNPVDALGRADTLVTRLNPVQFSFIPSTDFTRLQINGLSLTSEAPIAVTYAGGQTQQWNVKLTLSAVAKQPIGSMTVRLNCLDGGTFDSDLPIRPRFIFTRGSATRVLDCGSSTSACSVINLRSMQGCWRRLYPGSSFSPSACNVSPLPPNVDVDGNCDSAFEYRTIGRNSFLAGFDGCSSGCAQCSVIEQHPAGAMHTAKPSTGCQGVVFKGNPGDPIFCQIPSTQ